MPGQIMSEIKIKLPSNVAETMTQKEIVGALYDKSFARLNIIEANATSSVRNTERLAPPSGKKWNRRNRKNFRNGTIYSSGRDMNSPSRNGKRGRRSLKSVWHSSATETIRVIHRC